MAAVEVFANQPTTTVSSGGTDAPSSGTTETWTVASSSEFAAVSSTATPPTQFHVVDTAPGKTSEFIAVTDISGTTWTVTRGAEGSTPVTHASGFTVMQDVTAGVLAQFLQSVGATMAGWLAPAVVTLTDASTVAVNAALGNEFRVQLGGSRTIGAPSNPTDGQRITVHVQQPASGGPYTPAFASGAGGYSYGSGSAPTWSTSANAIDVTGWLYRADKSEWLFTGAVFGY